MTIGERIQQFREQRGLSQREFARRCGLSNGIISFIENGKRPNGDPYLPRYDTIRKIARVMGTSEEALIAECEDFDFDISVGPDETPLVLDYLNEIRNQSSDEAMLLQSYRMIPVEHRFEAMQAVFEIRKKYENE